MPEQFKIPRVNNQPALDLTHLDLSSVVGLMDTINKIDDKRVDRITDNYEALVKTQDKLLSHDVGTVPNIAKAERIRGKFGLSEDMFDLTPAELEDPTVAQRYQSQMGKMLNTPEYKELVMDGIRMNAYQESIEKLRQIDPSMAVLAMDKYNKIRYGQEKEDGSLFLPQDFSAADYERVDLDKLVAETIGKLSESMPDLRVDRTGPEPLLVSDRANRTIPMEDLEKMILTVYGDDENFRNTVRAKALESQRSRDPEDIITIDRLEDMSDVVTNVLEGGFMVQDILGTSPIEVALESKIWEGASYGDITIRDQMKAEGYLINPMDARAYNKYFEKYNRAPTSGIVNGEGFVTDTEGNALFKAPAGLNPGDMVFYTKRDDFFEDDGDASAIFDESGNRYFVLATGKNMRTSRVPQPESVGGEAPVRQAEGLPVEASPTTEQSSAEELPVEASPTTEQSSVDGEPVGERVPEFDISSEETREEIKRENFKDYNDNALTRAEEEGADTVEIIYGNEVLEVPIEELRGVWGELKDKIEKTLFLRGSDPKLASRKPVDSQSERTSPVDVVVEGITLTPEDIRKIYEDAGGVEVNKYKMGERIRTYTPSTKASSVFRTNGKRISKGFLENSKSKDKVIVGTPENYTYASVRELRGKESSTGLPIIDTSVFNEEGALRAISSEFGSRRDLLRSLTSYGGDKNPSDVLIARDPSTGETYYMTYKEAIDIYKNFGQSSESDAEAPSTEVQQADGFRFPTLGELAYPPPPIQVPFREPSSAEESPGMGGEEVTPEVEESPGMGGEEVTPEVEESPGMGGEEVTPEVEDSSDEINYGEAARILIESNLWVSEESGSITGERAWGVRSGYAGQGTGETPEEYAERTGFTTEPSWGAFQFHARGALPSLINYVVANELTYNGVNLGDIIPEVPTNQSESEDMDDFFREYGSTPPMVRAQIKIFTDTIEVPAIRRLGIGDGTVDDAIDFFGDNGPIIDLLVSSYNQGPGSVYVSAREALDDYLAEIGEDGEIDADILIDRITEARIESFPATSDRYTNEGESAKELIKNGGRRYQTAFDNIYDS